MAAICAADLVTTLWLVTGADAAEGNPVMRYYLERGVGPFIAVKMLMFVGPLTILEWARRRRPRFVRSMLRLGIALYLGSYVSGVYRLNAAAIDGPGALVVASAPMVMAAPRYAPVSDGSGPLAAPMRLGLRAPE